MPFPAMDLKGFSSSSHFPEDVSFPGERQVGFWKSEAMPDKNGAAGGKFAPSNQPKLFSVESWTSSDSHNRELFMREQRLNLNVGMFVDETEKSATGYLTSSKPFGNRQISRYSLNARPTSNFPEVDRINMMGTQHENSLFSSSLSELFSRKMKLTSNNSLYGHSIGTVASKYEEEEPLELLEDIEAQTIGNLLPDDDDLLSGVTDGLGFAVQSKGGDDIEELDLFSSVGGMDLEDDSFSEGHGRFECPVGVPNNLTEGNGSVNGEHPNGEHPSRTLFVRNINSNVEDTELRALFEQYGDIRTLYTACKHRGFVMISYYDIRAAQTAMKTLQNKPLRRRKLDIHYSIPKDNPSEKDINQGTLVIFNLDPSVSNEELHRLFGGYGEIKEIRETPHRSNHKFVEFYDVRAAEAALHEMNKSDIAGKQIKLEPSRLGGARRFQLQSSLELEQDEFDLYVKENGPAKNPITGLSGTGAMISATTDDILGMHTARRSPVVETAYHGISSSVPNSLPSLVRVGSLGSHPGLTESYPSLGRLDFDIHPALSLHPYSLPDHHDVWLNGIQCGSPSTVGASINSRSLERTDHRQLSKVGSNGRSLELNEGAFSSTGTGSCPVPGQYTWGNSYQPPPASMMWPNSPSFVNGFCTATAQPSSRLPGLPGAPSQMLNTVMPMKGHHVGSAPAINTSLWGGRQAYAGESPETSSFHPVSVGSMRIPNNSLNSMEFAHNIFPPVGGNIDIPMAPKSAAFQAHQQRNMMFAGRSQMMPLAASFDPPNERIRSRRNEAASNQAENKKQFELDLDCIMKGEDTRTTLMIKNIPNKYTSKMLLAAIDECHRGTYDFIYLPIDFKNKCNVGYAFINMTDPSQIIPFYQAFNGKKWEKFNSEKVASLAYARIQGKAALIAHFQNSSLMNEDKRCRPILFNTEGPNAGDQVPFPMGINVRSRPGKTRTSTAEENNQGSRTSLMNGEDSSNGDTSVGCLKDSD